MTKEFLTVKEVLDKLGISRASLYRLRKKKKFVEPAIKNPLRWRGADIDEYYS